MSRAYATPLRLDVEPSARRLFYYILLFVISLLSLVLANIPLAIQVLSVILISWLLRRDYLSRKGAFSLVWQGHNEWRLIHGPETTAASLSADSFNSPFLMILNFQLSGGGRRTLIVLPMEVDRNAYRRLRVRLKIEAGKLFAG